MTWVRLNCPAQLKSFDHCGRLLLEVSSTMAGPIRAKCPRCHTISVVFSSQGQVREPLRAVR